MKGSGGKGVDKYLLPVEMTWVRAKIIIYNLLDYVNIRSQSLQVRERGGARGHASREKTGGILSRSCMIR